MSDHRVLKLVAVLCVLGSATIVSGALAQQIGAPAPRPTTPEGAPSRRKSTESKKAPTQPTKATESGRTVEPTKRVEYRAGVLFKEGRLSVSVSKNSLESILEEISRTAGIAIIRAEGVGEELISIQFQDLLLDEGLRRILKDNDAFFFYGVQKSTGVREESTGEKASAALRALWVYAKGRGRGLMPVPPETWASTKEFEQKLTDPDPQVRANAVSTVIERKGEQAVDVVLQALSDRDDGVRTRALYGALSSGVTVPAYFLSDLALRDKSSDVRFLALQALAENPNSRAVAELALDDPNEHVRLKAQEILLQLDSATESESGQNE